MTLFAFASTCCGSTRLHAFAFEPSHFTMLVPRDPRAKLFSVIWRGGSREAAIVESKLGARWRIFCFNGQPELCVRDEMVQDLLRDFARRTEFRCQKHVGLFLERRALREQLANTFERFSFFQQRTMILVSRARKLLQAAPTGKRESVLLEARHVLRIHHETPPWKSPCDCAAPVPSRFFLLLAKGRFALLEKISLSFAGRASDDSVRIE